MKLDSIIYDTDTLKNALIEKLTAESSTFLQMYPSDTTTALLNSLAAYGAMLQYMLASYMANCYISTAFSETGVYQLAETLGNTLHGNVSAQVTATFIKHNFVTINTVIPKETQFIIDNKKFFNPSTIILPPNKPETYNIVLVQGEMIEVTKTAGGIQGEKVYFSSDFKANYNYIEVYVNDEEWTQVDNFIDHDKNYVIDDTELNVYIMRTDPDGKAYIQFGDDQLGLVPAQGSTIRIKYVSNDGADGNIESSGAIGTSNAALIYTDNNGNTGALDLEIITTSTAYGGFGKQSIDTLRKTSPHVFASGNRAIRRQDYRAMLQNKCGYLTAQVWGEYEEAAKVGTYDSLMMNTVYYTGLKSFEDYEPESIGTVHEVESFSGSVNTTKGFLGSFKLNLSALNSSEAKAELLDNNGKGFLFFNKDAYDPRDDLLNDWKDSGAAVTVTTSEDSTATQLNPISNVRSDKSDSAIYQSLEEPTLLQPIQIIFDYQSPRTISGFKFKAADRELGGFPAIVSIFATNATPIPSLTNIRNSADWTCVVDRTSLVRPDQATTGGWTNWLPTNCFKGTKNGIGVPEFDSYKTYVIEIYAVEEGAESLVTLNKIKALYGSSTSIIYYDIDGDIDLVLPTKKNERQEITWQLVNSKDFPMYAYNASPSGITLDNGYKNGNVLAYKYEQGSTTYIFTVKVLDIDNGEFIISLNNSTTLAGYVPIDLQQPVSLDRTVVYDMFLDSSQPIVNPGLGYVIGDVLEVDNTNSKVILKVASVNNAGEITALDYVSNRDFDRGYEGTLTTTNTTGTGSGCTVTIYKKCMSGDGTVLGSGAKLAIKTVDNLQITAAFKGNRMDINDTQKYDQPIIDKYNHFTTYIQFKQPEIQQQNITANVCLNTSASMTSGLIIQNIKNNVNKLFEITSDCIGRGLKVSDVYKAITDTPNVVWCKVIEPYDNVDVDINKLLVANDITITEIVNEFK